MIQESFEFTIEMVVDAQYRGSEDQELRNHEEHIRSNVVLIGNEKGSKRQGSSHDKRCCRNPLFQETSFIHSRTFYTWNSLRGIETKSMFRPFTKFETKEYKPPSI
jgi:hypothetical protein